MITTILSGNLLDSAIKVGGNQLGSDNNNASLFLF